MVEYEEIVPGTEIINAIRAEKSPFWAWAGEVIDNAFDASATDIWLIMNSAVLCASDNGHGIRKGQEHALVKIAEHLKLAGTQLGRYGVGLKYKAIQHGDVLDVKSVSRDGKMTRTVNWSQILKSGSWAVMCPKWSDTKEHSGTRIAIEKLLRHPSKSDIARTKVEIQRRYYPALEKKNKIYLNGDLIEPFPQPALSNIIEDCQSFPGGREAYIKAGIISSPSTAKLRQVDIIVGYRVIEAESPFGCNGYGGVRSMFARIELVGPWKLEKFKSQIADDPYEKDLEAWAETVLRPILEKCNTASMSLHTKKLEGMLNEMLPEEYRVARPEHKQKLGRIGDKLGNQGTVRDAKENKSGPAKKKSSSRGIMIEFADGLDNEYGHGRAQFGKITRIQLSNDNPQIARLKSYRDEQMAVECLYAIAIYILEGDLMTAQPRLIDTPIGLRAWKLMQQQPTSILRVVA